MPDPDTPVFWEKVRRPDPRGLPRVRLEERLLGPEAPSTGLVLGPPGSGKTTLLSWVAARAGVPTAWYRADAEDTDERALVRHVAHALATTAEEPPDPVGAVETVDELVAALQLRGGPVLVVLDDVHELAGQRAERALERLVRLRPRAVRLLIGARRPPAVNVSRLLVSGDLVQLDAEDLRFRSWETEELFRAVYGAPLSPETAAALTRRTGGWAAGLQLFHLGSGGLSRPERERAVGELSGRSRLIRSYLARNVLAGLDERRRRFLLLTSTLGVLTGESCDELLGETGSAAVLDELEQQHFFTTSLDDGRTFRYHQVLQTHLEVVLADEVGEEAVRTAYRRSAELLERSGRPGAAVRAYARAEDWAAVSRLLPGHASTPLPEDVVAWAGAGRDDPGLLLAAARRLTADGRLDEAVEVFRHAESSMDDLEFRARCAAERRAASALSTALPDLAAPVPASPVQRLAVELRRAATDLRGPAPTTNLARVVTDLLAGDLAAAREDVARAARERPVVADQPHVLGLVAELLTALDARRAPDLTVLDDLSSAAERAGRSWVARLARGLGAAALLLEEPSDDRLGAGLDLLDDDVLLGDPWSQLLLAVAVGAAALVGGADAAGLEALARARALAGRLGAPVADAWVTVLLGPRVLPGEDGPPSAAERLRDARAVGLEVPAVLRDGLRPPPGRREPAPVRRSATDVVLRTLGAFAVEVDGTPVDLSGLRPRAQHLLMALAAHHGRPVHRERLVDDLWPDVALGPGVRSLQVAVSSVRHRLARAGLGDGALERRGEAYVLCLAGCADQRADFEDLARQADADLAGGDPAAALRARVAALARYGGDLLPEVGPAEWVVGERARLATLATRVALGAASLALEQDDVASAIAAAARAVQLDPYTDVGWTLLARAHLHNGDAAAAAVVQREHDRVVGELGIPPGGPPARLSARVSRPPRRSRAARAPA